MKRFLAYAWIAAATLAFVGGLVYLGITDPHSRVPLVFVFSAIVGLCITIWAINEVDW